MSKKLHDYLQTYKENNDSRFKNSEQLAKVRGRTDSNPTDPYSQHEIKTTEIFCENKNLSRKDIKVLNDDDQAIGSQKLAKVKGNIDKNATDPYLQHEIRSTEIPVETDYLVKNNQIDLRGEDNKQHESKQLAKVKERIDQDLLDPYIQHEIISTEILEETRCLIGED